jgi:predicted transposase YbfD/YdcC
VTNDYTSNEIIAISEFIKVLELSRCLVTIDAMRTQKEIAKLIIDRGADYCLALKGNQGNIYQDVEQLFSQASAHNWQDIEHSFYQTVEKGHGRLEIRRYCPITNVEFLIDSDK